MFGLFKKCLFTVMMFFGCNVLNVNLLKYVSINNQECEIKTKIIDINNNPYSIKVNKRSGICNNINDSYGKLCVPDVVIKINVRVFNIMPRTNETRHIKWHETYKCKCRFDGSVCNKKTTLE